MNCPYGIRRDPRTEPIPRTAKNFVGDDNLNHVKYIFKNHINFFYICGQKRPETDIGGGKPGQDLLWTRD